MEVKNSSHENTYWKRTLMYSIMSVTAISCSMVAMAIVRFTYVDPIQFIKSMVISIGVDELFGRPILILLFSLILQDSEKMKRLMARYEFIESSITQVAAVEQQSNEAII